MLRLLDEAGVLLAWAEVWASPCPQPRPSASCPFWPTAPTYLKVIRDGMASQTSVHWCDLDIARVNALVEPIEVRVGQVFTFTWMEPVWLVAGMRDVPLPAVVEERSVTIGVPAAHLGMVGQS